MYAAGDVDEDTWNPLNPAWLGAQLGRPVFEVVREDMVGAGGFHAEMFRILVRFSEGGSATYVVKSTGPSDMRKAMGLAREALFYRQLAPVLVARLGGRVRLLPHVVCAHGSMATGRKLIVMEDLSASVQSGYFFGPGSPHNWDNDLGALTHGWDLSPEAVTTMAFQSAARMHAAFWQDNSLLEYEWLRGSQWLRGEGQAAWTDALEVAASAWARAKAKWDQLESGSCEPVVVYDPLVVQCIDASFAKASWTGFQEEVQARPWTLAHGDFHPANMMVQKSLDGGEFGICTVDFEVIGLGSGPQDLGQYMISHCPPDVRASIERAAVEAYCAGLARFNASIATSMPVEAAWLEYVNGGAGRWMWMLPVLVDMCPPKMVQFFHDQVRAFLRTHGVSAKNVPMPRV